jgi:hypothetical protein
VLQLVELLVARMTIGIRPRLRFLRLTLLLSFLLSLLLFLLLRPRSLLGLGFLARESWRHCRRQQTSHQQRNCICAKHKYSGELL